jgi:excisionase family DNA binding protein
VKYKVGSSLGTSSVRTASGTTAVESSRQKIGISVQQPTPINGLYTIDEAARRLHLRPTWLYERTRRNAIPHHRFGKYIRFTDADLDAIITMASQPEPRSGASESA